MRDVRIIDHPLIQHKLTIMRDRATSTASFRRLLQEISHLLCYELTRDLELEMVPIITPVAMMMAPRLAGKKLDEKGYIVPGLGDAGDRLFGTK